MSASNPSSDLGDTRSLGLHERAKAQTGNPGAPQLVLTCNARTEEA